MKLKSVLVAAIAASLSIVPVAAQATDQPLPTREASELSVYEQMGGGGWFVPGLALVAIILGILAATGGDDDDLPVSP